MEPDICKLGGQYLAEGNQDVEDILMENIL
jgi:hypothetical protein